MSTYCRHHHHQHHHHSHTVDPPRDHGFSRKCGRDVYHTLQLRSVNKNHTSDSVISNNSGSFPGDAVYAKSSQDTIPQAHTINTAAIDGWMGTVTGNSRLGHFNDADDYYHGEVLNAKQPATGHQCRDVHYTDRLECGHSFRCPAYLCHTLIAERIEHSSGHNGATRRPVSI